MSTPAVRHTQLESSVALASWRRQSALRKVLLTTIVASFVYITLGTSTEASVIFPDQKETKAQRVGIFCEVLVVHLSIQIECRSPFPNPAEFFLAKVKNKGHAYSIVRYDGNVLSDRRQLLTLRFGTWGSDKRFIGEESNSRIPARLYIESFGVTNILQRKLDCYWLSNNQWGARNRLQGKPRAIEEHQRAVIWALKEESPYTNEDSPYESNDAHIIGHRCPNLPFRFRAWVISLHNASPRVFWGIIAGFVPISFGLMFSGTDLEADNGRGRVSGRFFFGVVILIVQLSFAFSILL